MKPLTNKEIAELRKYEEGPYAGLVDRLLDEVEARRAEKAGARALLKRIEWAGAATDEYLHFEGDACPACSWRKDEGCARSRLRTRDPDGGQMKTEPLTAGELTDLRRTATDENYDEIASSPVAEPILRLLDEIETRRKAEATPNVLRYFEAMLRGLIADPNDHTLFECEGEIPLLARRTATRPGVTEADRGGRHGRRRGDLPVLPCVPGAARRHAVHEAPRTQARLRARRVAGGQMKPLHKEEIAELASIRAGGVLKAETVNLFGRLLDEVGRSRALLKRIEWSATHGDDAGCFHLCPYCCAMAPSNGGKEHAPGCELAALIGKKQ